MKHFVDLAQIEVKAGDGGDGLASFRHEKYVPKGGPDGGNGGDGGDVFVQVDSALTTLYDFAHRHIFQAEDGGPGRKAQMTGKSGDDLVMKVPVGTVVYEIVDPESEEARLRKIVDLSNEGKKVMVAKGGVGGRGNTTFKSSTNQAPLEYELGTKGEGKKIVLELKMVADIGLIGKPNAGKSTLLAHLTNAKPQIGDYPFTTLRPNLGMMQLYDQQIVLADIPGLIAGAAEGKGLGDDFLRHIERTRILVHLIDPIFQDPIKAYEEIRDELEAYSKKLLDKPEVVVINKVDVTEVKAALRDYEASFKEKYGLSVVGIAAATGEGFEDLSKAIFEEYSRVQDVEIELDEEGATFDEGPVFTIDDVRSVTTKREIQKIQRKIL